MKKNYIHLLIIFAILSFTSCNRKNPNMLSNGSDQKKTETVGSASNLQLKTLDDIKDKRVGVLIGSIHDAYATKNFPNAQILQYQNFSDLVIAVNTDKIDAAFFSHAYLPEVMSANPDVGILIDSLWSVGIGAGFNKENHKLRDQFNTFLHEIKTNGVHADMVNRWMENRSTEMPDIKTNTINGQIRVGTVSDMGVPFAFIKDGKLVGFDVELSTRFAAYLGKALIPVDMQFGSLLAAVSTNKIDVIISSLAITEERKKQIDFSGSYYDSEVSIIANKKNLPKESSRKMEKADDLADKRIGIFGGTVHDAFVASKYPKATVSQYSSSSDMILSLKTDKIDAAMFDAITARILLKSNPDLGLLTDKIFDMPLGVGFNKNNPELRNEFNSFLKKIRTNGVYDEMFNRWFVDDPEKAVIHPFKNPDSQKNLTAAVSVEDLPYVSNMNGDYVGFDIEMIKRFAESSNYHLEIVTIAFPALVAALASGKADMIADGIAISAERSKQIDFSDSYAEFRTAVVASKKNLGGYKDETIKPVKPSFLKSVSNSFYSNIILENRYLMILDGLKVTILISILSAIFGTLVGALVCFMRMSKRKILSLTARLYISLIRGTPVLVLLMIIYYVIFASVNINPTLVAVVAFGLNFGAYVSEMFRSSIQSIDNGQREAGIASGFSGVQTFIYIIMPQAIRQVLPVYKGEFISLLKMTSVVGYIAVQDLTKASDIIRSRTFDAFFPLIMAAVLYIIIAGLLTWALGYVEMSVDPKRKRKNKQLEVKL
jgi:polar amino acid transport system substrate-binding protein